MRLVQDVQQLEEESCRSWRTHRASCSPTAHQVRPRRGDHTPNLLQRQALRCPAHAHGCRVPPAFWIRRKLFWGPAPIQNTLLFEKVIVKYELCPVCVVILKKYFKSPYLLPLTCQPDIWSPSQKRFYLSLGSTKTIHFWVFSAYWSICIGKIFNIHNSDTWHFFPKNNPIMEERLWHLIPFKSLFCPSNFSEGPKSLVMAEF